MSAKSLSFLVAVAAALAAWPAVAADEPPARAVAATVDDDPIYVDEIEQLLAAVAQQEANVAALPVVQAQLLEQLIALRLIDRQLAAGDYAATDAEVDAALAAFQAQLKAQNVDFDQFLAGRKLTLERIRRQIATELARKKFLAGELNDAALEAYFEAHRREFDGSELAVSHILLRPATSAGAKGLAETIVQAQKLRQQIFAGDVKFADAARKHSVGPSARGGGALGYIPRHGVMAESFAKAAFALGDGEVSQPVQTRFGIHLIQVTGAKPGTGQWTDARHQLVTAAGKERLEKLAAEQRSRATLRYTGAVPYVDPQTKNVVLPGGKP